MPPSAAPPPVGQKRGFQVPPQNGVEIGSGHLQKRRKPIGACVIGEDIEDRHAVDGLGQGGKIGDIHGNRLGENLGNGAPMPRPVPVIYASLPAREKFGSWPRLSANLVALARFRGRH